ncbi:MAG: hypothetical protein ACREMB_17805 [Candidatus Rokuibacteriota bacterium]
MTRPADDVPRPAGSPPAARLRLAGWLSIASAVVAVPILAWTLAAASAGQRAVELGLQSAMLAMYVYVITTFRALLHRRFAFHEVDAAIQGLIWLNVLSALLGFVGSGREGGEELTAVVGLATMILYGIVTAVYGTRLLRLPADLFGLRRPYGYTTIAAGVGTGLVVLLPLGLLAGIVADVFLGLILLRAASA